MKLKLAIIVCIAILSIFIYVTHSSSNNVEDYRDDNDKQWKRTINLSKVNEQSLQINDHPDHLLRFVQISDIHISIFNDDQRIHDFRIFATETLDTIRPSVVLASGDLTDAKDKDHIGSRQYEKEWKIYNEILNEANVRNKTIWMDIRGNHDTFNVPPLHKTKNISYFQQYSIQGAQHKRSYMKMVNGTIGDVYSFIAVDASLEPGPKRPFNFFGSLSQNDVDHIQGLIDQSRKAGSNYTIWFGHYPTSCVLTMNGGSRSFRRIISDDKNGLSYMCGHLHTLAGMVPHMYSLQENSFLELELADFKSTRRYRVAAIDHGLLSFVDVQHNSWPVVLITNPKHSMFHIPHRQEAKIQLDSTHIRLLAFSPAGITNCTVLIDDDFMEKCRKVSDNLFVVDWDPKRYLKGLHSITAVVVDGYGRENQVTQPFKLTESDTQSFEMLARFVLMNDISTIFKYSFWFAWTLCVAPLVFFRLWHCLVMAGKLSRKRGNCRTSMSCAQQFWTLSTVDRIFWPILIYCVYLAVGPWAICEIIDNHYGAIFIWGVYVDGSYLPGGLTYLYGFFQLMLCQFPLIWIYAKSIEKRYYEVVGMPTKKHRGSMCSLRKLSYAPFYMIIVIEILLAIFFGLAYGTVAFLMGPFRTWSVVMNLTLWYMARNVPDHTLRPAIYVWSASEKTSTAEQTEPMTEM